MKRLGLAILLAVWLVLYFGLVGFALTGREAKQEALIANSLAEPVGPGVRHRFAITADPARARSQARSRPGRGPPS